MLSTFIAELRWAFKIPMCVVKLWSGTLNVLWPLGWALEGVMESPAVCGGLLVHEGASKVMPRWAIANLVGASMCLSVVTWCLELERGSIVPGGVSPTHQDRNCPWKNQSFLFDGTLLWDLVPGLLLSSLCVHCLPTKWGSWEHSQVEVTEHLTGSAPQSPKSGDWQLKALVAT